jgi:trans-2,3-dihydro-3-hydroxyanthranilate isomerase
MQSIANEMNLSETVFVLPSRSALKRLRIFTPKQELPLAGHPVVGTWNLLAHLGITPQTETGIVKIQQELKLGVLDVDIEFNKGLPNRVEMTQGKFEAGRTVSDEDEIRLIAEGLGISRKNIISNDNLPIQVASTGIKALLVPVNSAISLEKCRINSSLLSQCYLKYGAVGVYTFTFDTIEKDSGVNARFFAPDDNITEDPATGSAAGSLSGYLIYHQAIEKRSFKIEQGDYMNRPSRIYANVDGEKGKVKTVKIGGCSVIVAKGEIYLD